MRKKFFIFFILFFTVQAYAATCPTPEALRNHQWDEWVPYDIDSGEPANTEKQERFLQQVDKFALAEWLEDSPEGDAHCYYASKNAEPIYLNVYWAKYHLVFDPNLPDWKPVGNNAMQCNKSIEECRFQ
ncbi:hypothetical protein AYO45_03775 [Gammaproteobacteria bacterium SCGC AG-212-F23]|nr:hypothetical protein AYO45_03775 [Gammaproteobacteria bacterium SCGC AG-212-F23]